VGVLHTLKYLSLPLGLRLLSKDKRKDILETLITIYVHNSIQRCGANSVTQDKCLKPGEDKKKKKKELCAPFTVNAQ
jgi:hypothetical protein